MLQSHQPIFNLLVVVPYSLSASHFVLPEVTRLGNVSVTDNYGAWVAIPRGHVFLPPTDL